MFCPNCGNKNDDSSAFCAWCGTPLKNFAPPTPPVQQPAQPVQQPIQQPVQAQEPVYPAPVQPEQAPVYPEPEPEPVEESNNCEDVRCSNCGAQMPGDERVCPNCGHICISEVDEEEEESSSKGKIIGIIIGAIVLLGGIAFLGHKMEWWELPFLSSNATTIEEAPEELDFDRISGTINAESGISGTFNYDIAWPEGGDADVRNEIRSWIFKTIFDKPYTQGDNLKESLNTAAQEFFANNSDIDGPLKTITVKDESEDTFDGYLNLQASIFTNAEGGSRRSNFFENSKFQLIMRLDDNKIITSNELKGQNAIKDANKIRRLIHKYQNISEYLDENEVPTVDETCLYLSKDGVSIASYNSVFNRGRLETFCIIPYAEAIPMLSDEIKAFLPENLVADADAAAMEGLTEDLMRSLITKANIEDPDAFSSGLKNLIVKNKSLYGPHYDYQSDWDFTIFKFAWSDPERYMVRNPEVKIMEYYLENGRKIVRAVFDVRDRDIQTGWFSQGSCEPTLFAADFIKEDGKWVVDDIYTQDDPYGHPIQAFDIQRARSFKKEVKSDIDNYNSIDWTEREDWDV